MSRLGLMVLSLVFYFVVTPGKFDLYHSMTAALAAVIVGLVWLRQVKKAQEESRQMMELDPELAAMMDSSDSLGAILLRGALLAILFFVLAVGLAWLGSKTPVYALFYDEGHQQFLRELEVLAEEKEYEAAVRRIDQRLKEPLSQRRQRELAQLKYDYLIDLGQKPGDIEEKRAAFSRAEAWAEEWGLDSSLANAERRAVAGTPTAVPSPTPMPTYTPAPTATPQPTATPLPPDPERPPLDLSKCEAQEVSNEFAAGGQLQAWDCGEWGWYGQWQPSDDMNSIGGRLPQAYHSSKGGFKLCPPAGESQTAYTAVSCD